MKISSSYFQQKINSSTEQGHKKQSIAIHLKKIFVGIRQKIPEQRGQVGQLVLKREVRYRITVLTKNRLLYFILLYFTNTILTAVLR